MKVKIRHLVVPTLVVAGGMLLAACGAGSPDRSPTTTANDSDAAPVPGERAPDFELTLYQGQEELGSETILLSEVLDRGEPVVLNFWAGLCPPCRLEMPDLQSSYDNRADQLILIGVDIGPFTNLGSREEGRALLQDLGVSYPAGTTFNESILQEYSVLGMPSTYFITPEGEIVESWSGLLNEEKMTELMDELLAASS